MKKSIITILILLGTALSLPVIANETIDDFNVLININSDSSVDITEEIIYNFNTEQKHGIYRDIPYKYKARGGNYSLIISDISVINDAGDPFLFDVANENGNKHIKIGNSQSYVTGRIKYVIRYRVERAINYFSEHDELYWNSTGNGWEVPIKQVRTELVIPGSVDEDVLKTECFAGAVGSDSACISTRYIYTGKNTVNKISFTNDRLKPGEGMTIVVGLPKGVIVKPLFFFRVLNILKDNLILGLPLFVFAALYYLWRTRGRDPEGRGTIIAEYSPPDNLSPSEVGTIIDERAHKRDISADIVNLAVLGYIKIRQLEKKGILGSIDYEFQKLKDGGGLTNAHERKLFNAIFSDNKNKVKLSSLKNKFYKDLAEIKKLIYESTVTKGYFPHNPNKVRITYLSSGIAIIILSWFLGSIFGFLGVISIALSGLLAVIFSFYMPVKTHAGALARDHILGLKEYLKVAEKDRIKFHNAPSKKSELFEKLLPFAMVLGVEKEWAGQFKDIYKDSPDWYESAGRRNFSALMLARSLDNFQTKVNTTLASQPSSASSGGSGFSGGGSGGGFGGGGGGSW